MKVFKFGGASVSSAPAIRNVAAILDLFPGKKAVVISAMGNTTNELEKLVRSYYKRDSQTDDILSSIENYHRQIIDALDLATISPIRAGELFDQLRKRLKRTPSLHFD